VCDRGGGGADAGKVATPVGSSPRRLEGFRVAPCVEGAATVQGFRTVMQRQPRCVEGTSSAQSESRSMFQVVIPSRRRGICGEKQISPCGGDDSCCMCLNVNPYQSCRVPKMRSPASPRPGRM